MVWLSFVVLTVSRARSSLSLAPVVLSPSAVVPGSLCACRLSYHRQPLRVDEFSPQGTVCVPGVCAVRVCRAVQYAGGSALRRRACGLAEECCPWSLRAASTVGW